MMFSDEEIKEIPEASFLRSGDEIISIREVCLNDKYDNKKDFAFHGDSLLSNSSRSDNLFREFFPESEQASFAWTEEDGNIASLVSEAGFGTTGQTSFGKDLDAALKSELKQEADTSTTVFHYHPRNGMTFATKSNMDSQHVSSTSNGIGDCKGAKSTHKVDKTDPRSRFHYVKYVKRHGRTIKLWECGICSREFQHQYTLMRHLPTHTDERNFHCSACGKSFRQLSTLSQHRAIHSADRPYSCELKEECETKAERCTNFSMITYSRGFTLRGFISSDKVCSKTFNRVSTLISHRKTHSDDKPYKCSICPKGFHQKGNLRNHMFTHTNERPYRCNICLKGFNQQSNLVCHKSKAHPEDGANVVRTRSTPRILRAPPETQPVSTRPPVNICEVSSSVGPYLPSIDGSTPPNFISKQAWDAFKDHPDDFWGNEGFLGSGVIVDAINTYYMEVAIATKQTPFALLKPNNSAPVLVKVVDTSLPGGKQMLVPATAEDLKEGGKIVLNKDDNTNSQHAAVNNSELGVQIRVPVVATVVPRFNASGRLQLMVEEPHYAYHTALSSDLIPEPCAHGTKFLPPPPPIVPRPELPEIHRRAATYQDSLQPGGISSSCTLPPPAPSPPLDLMLKDLFEPMECIPLGPQITPVDIDQSPPSDDSDIFIGQFEESISLSDSE